MNKEIAKKPGGTSGKKKGSGFNRRLSARTAVLVVTFALIVLAILINMSKYAVFDREEWEQKVVSQQQRDTEVPAERGTIYDCNMETLVQSAPAWLVAIRPDDIPESLQPSVVRELSAILGLSEEYIQGRVDYVKNSETLYEANLRGKADKQQYDRITTFMENTTYTDPETGKEKTLSGINLFSDTRRYYFQGTLASTILGFTNSENRGIYGVEASYNSELSGTPGRIVTIKNARNGDMPVDYTTLVEAEKGNSLVLTVDANIQSILEKYLNQAYVDNKLGKGAAGIIMNVNTGAVLGMASVPNYDPDKYDVLVDRELAAEIDRIVDDEQRAKALAAAQEAQWRNKAISDMYDPGSVFKPITMAAALEENFTELSDMFFCPGYKVMGGKRRNCHKASGHGSETLTEAMMNSCNPVFMTLAERMGGSLFFKYFEGFGFTEKTGIDLPGEAVPTAGVTYYTAKGLEDQVTLAACSFGQANNVSPIQMATAIAAISNGGYLVTPHVVDSVIDQNGNPVKTVDTTVKRQIISAETSATINAMLEKTVSGGTAKNGYVAGYRIGGKTGTSENLKNPGQYIASYCAIAPSDDPEIVILVVLDEPHGANHMGGTIAAPVVRNVLSEVLPYLDVETIYSDKEVTNLDVLTPDVVGLSVTEAKTILNAKNLNVRIIGNGEAVVDQVPRSASIAKGSTVILATDPAQGIPTAEVPDVVGMSPADVNAAIVGAGLNIRCTGSAFDSKDGMAVKQDKQPGTVVPQGTVITVEFMMSGATD